MSTKKFQSFEMPKPDWSPFVVSSDRHAPRAVDTREGLSDRMRAAAFAELQAREAFKWAAERFTDAPDELRALWVEFSDAEDRHLGWILKRMEELGFSPAERTVHDHLWRSFEHCQTAREFAHFIARAEDRGKDAGLRFEKALRDKDPVTAEIFLKIANEEVHHIETAFKFFPADSH